MNTYSNLEQWAEEAFKDGRENHLRLVNALVPLEVQAEIKSDVEMGNISAEEAGARLYAICYADHVTAELQAENATLRAKVAELQAVQADLLQKAGEISSLFGLLRNGGADSDDLESLEHGIELAVSLSEEMIDLIGTPVEGSQS